MEANSCISSHQTATNWKISRGSIVDVVAFESSAAADDEVEDKNSAASAAKAPVFLSPSAPDSEPCEISITFPQKYELRQVYVRSTARVYEIYCAKKLNLSSEYLCTVRCGIATRDEQVLQAPCIEEADLANSKGNNKKSVGLNEDDWVEVENSDSAIPNNGENLSVASQESTQDFYEATAEINDAEPCISITIRLLSLQDKSCLFVDEVYIFADPVDSTDSEREVSGPESSATGSLMAMFMPTLLQLSRAKGSTWGRDKQTSDESEKKMQENLRNTNKSADTVNESQQEIQRQMNLPGVGTTAKPEEVDNSARVCGPENTPMLPFNHMEIVLQQLVSRICKLENVLSRFEERLLAPIYSIDGRLQQVENKLEELTKKSQSLSCGKVVAPEFASNDTDPNPYSTAQSKSPDAKSNGLYEESPSQLPTGTPVSALELSCRNTNLDSSSMGQSKSSEIESSGYQEEEPSAPNPTDETGDPCGIHYSIPGIEEVPRKSDSNGDVEENESSVSESTEDKPKSSLSVDDALASALAGFLSSTLPVERTYTQALSVKAPEFSNEEDCGATDKKVTADDLTAQSSNLLACSGAKECLNDSFSSSSGTFNTENEAESVRRIENDLEKVSNDSDEESHNGRGDGSNVTELETDYSREITENGKATNLTMSDSVDNYANDPDMCMQKGILNSNSGFVNMSTEVKETPEINDVLRSVLGFSHASSSVNFEIPILDVKFNTRESTIDKSSIEALFGSLPDSDAGSVATAEHIHITDGCNLISVENSEIIGPPTDTLVSSDMNYCDLTYCRRIDTHLKLKGETQHNNDGSINDPVKDLTFEKSLV